MGFLSRIYTLRRPLSGTKEPGAKVVDLGCELTSRLPHLSLVTLWIINFRAISRTQTGPSRNRQGFGMERARPGSSKCSLGAVQSRRASGDSFGMGANKPGKRCSFRRRRCSKMLEARKFQSQSLNRLSETKHPFSSFHPVLSGGACVNMRQFSPFKSPDKQNHVCRTCDFA